MNLRLKIQKSTAFRKAFTIPELSIVITIIAILLSISIIAYGTWRKQVAVTETQSDLTNLLSTMESARNFDNGYPTAIPSDYSSSDTVTVTYISGDTDGFCVESRSTLYDDVRYFAEVTNGSGEVLRGTCLGGIEYDPQYTAMVFDLNAPGCVGTTIQLPIYTPSNSGGAIIKWGDGLENVFNTSNQTHTYAAKGEYTVLYDGPITNIDTNWVAGDARPCLTKITQWGSGAVPDRLRLVGSRNLTYVPEELPSSVDSLEGAFNGATSFNQPIGDWDISNVTRLDNAFEGATSFNQPLNNWDTSNVTALWDTFKGASSFNQPLNNWDVSSVTGFGSMFAYATVFNQNINNWDMSSATDTNSMFRNTAAFNQPLNNWNMSNVRNLDSMFAVTDSFNQNISSWNVSSVTNFNHIFNSARVFNQPLNSWDVSSGSTFIQTFRNAQAFNQPLDSWNMSNATSIQEMFADTAVFNQNINSWDVSGLTNFFRLFQNAQAFNQPLNNWDTSNVTRMEQMFQFNFVFAQNISNWNVSNVYDVYNANKRNGNFVENQAALPNNYLPTFPQ